MLLFAVLATPQPYFIKFHDAMEYIFFNVLGTCVFQKLLSCASRGIVY